MTVGDWPCFAPNGTALNGGIPQRGDLDRHLAKVKSDIAARLPVGFDGYAVIDWEVWVPWFSGACLFITPARTDAPAHARTLYTHAHTHVPTLTTD